MAYLPFSIGAWSGGSLTMTSTSIPHRAGIYLALVQLLFTLGWTVYAIFLPRLAAEVGIPRTAVIFILMLDQAIFTVTDVAMGVAADRVSNLVGRLGYWVAAITALSCIAFLALPFVAGIGSSAQPWFLGLTVLWAVTSSALRAPPLMLLGKYAARPAIPYLSSLAMLGFGLAGAAAPYLTVTLRNLDPRLPFALSSMALLLTVLGLASVERALARQAVASPAPVSQAAGKRDSITGSSLLFVIAMVVLGLGYQLHFAINSAPLFLRFAKPADLDLLMPVFWIGFNIAMFPASLLTRRWGGVVVMGGAGLIGAAAVLAAGASTGLDMLIAAQFVAGAAWGCILMSAVTAALTISENGHQGRLVGLMFSALALATFARMAAVASGFQTDPSYAPLFQWAPTLCWSAAGAALLYLSLRRMQAWAAAY
jgi:MFS family permease